MVTMAFIIKLFVTNKLECLSLSLTFFEDDYWLDRLGTNPLNGIPHCRFQLSLQILDSIGRDWR